MHYGNFLFLNLESWNRTKGHSFSSWGCLDLQAFRKRTFYSQKSERAQERKEESTVMLAFCVQLHVTCAHNLCLWGDIGSWQTPLSFHLKPQKKTDRRRKAESVSVGELFFEKSKAWGAEMRREKFGRDSTQGCHGDRNGRLEPHNSQLVTNTPAACTHTSAYCTLKLT